MFASQRPLWNYSLKIYDLNKLLFVHESDMATSLMNVPRRLRVDVKIFSE